MCHFVKGIVEMKNVVEENDTRQAIGSLRQGAFREAPRAWDTGGTQGSTGHDWGTGLAGGRLGDDAR